MYRLSSFPPLLQSLSLCHACLESCFVFFSPVIPTNYRLSGLQITDIRVYRRGASGCTVMIAVSHSQTLHSRCAHIFISNDLPLDSSRSGSEAELRAHRSKCSSLSSPQVTTYDPSSVDVSISCHVAHEVESILNSFALVLGIPSDRCAAYLFVER